MLSVLFDMINCQPVDPFAPDAGRQIRQYLLCKFDQIQGHLVPEVRIFIFPP